VEEMDGFMSEKKGKIIYFDNAATSFPKPAAVTESVLEYMTKIGGNPGRSGHALSIESGDIVFSARDAVADLFGINNPMKVVFCFNATDALNLGIQGILKKGDHAVTTSMEHNSTIRPLTELQKEGRISLTIIECENNGRLDLQRFADSLTPKTRLAVVNHGSNVFGTVQDISGIGKICRDKGIIFLVDAAQTAGIIPVDMNESNIDLLAFAGHKGLYGPTGTGGLVLGEKFDHSILRPLRFGGTGSFSDRIEQPDFLPDRFESGTLNAAGLAGLQAGVEFITSREKGIPGIYEHKKNIVNAFVNSCRRRIRGFTCYADPEIIDTGVVSFNIKDYESSKIAEILSDEFNIMSRAGLHCAPLAHKTFHSFPEGTVRFGFSIFNTLDEIETSVESLEKIIKGKV